MKNVYHRLAVATTLTIVVSWCLIVPAAGHAQPLEMTVRIPFDFYVADQKYPAGDYKIQQKAITGITTLVIMGQRTPNRFILTMPVTNPHPERETSLIFNKYGADLFLSEAHWRGAELGHKLQVSPLERELARSLTPERVAAGGKNP
jgi:hypothetical protein